jgi:hypothetical protein
MCVCVCAILVQPCDIWQLWDIILFWLAQLGMTCDCSFHEKRSNHTTLHLALTICPFDVLWFDEMSGYPRFCSYVFLPGQSRERFSLQKKHSGFRKASSVFFLEWYVGGVRLSTGLFCQRMGPNGLLLRTQQWTLVCIKADSSLTTWATSSFWNAPVLELVLARVCERRLERRLPKYLTAGISALTAVC